MNTDQFFARISAIGKASGTREGASVALKCLDVLADAMKYAFDEGIRAGVGSSADAIRKASEAPFWVRPSLKTLEKILRSEGGR